MGPGAEHSRSLVSPNEQSGARGHVGGKDVVAVAVEVLADPVVAHGGFGVGMPSGDLYVTQAHARIQRGPKLTAPASGGSIVLGVGTYRAE